MKVLHLLASGGVGGIEILCKDYSAHSEHDNFFLFVWYGGSVADEMKAAGRKVIDLQSSKRNLFGPLRAILSLCRRENIDSIVIHHTSPKMYLYAMCVKALSRTKNIIIYAHNDAADMYPADSKLERGLRKCILQFAFSRASRIVAISESVKRSLHRYFRLRDEQVAVIYNGVDVDRFTPAPEGRTGCAELIYVGRLIEEKGVQNILRLLSLLPGDIDYRFRIIGDGPHREPLEQLCRDLGLQARVSFLGTRRDVPALLHSSDIFLHMPAWEEGFGITIIEAMACGLIAFCAASGAIPEIIRDGVDGVLADRSNLPCAADVLANIIRNIRSEDSNAMRRRAILRAGDFSIAAFSRALDHLLSETRGKQP